MSINSFIETRAKKLLAKNGIKLGGNQPWDIKVYDNSIYTDLIIRGTLGLGDGYTKGKWDSKNVDQFIYKILKDKKPGGHSPIYYVNAVRDKLFNTQSGRRAFHVGENHYDLGNDMYELMLGESMGYSSGLFFDKSDSLDTAQYNKFDNICQQLNLKPGMKVLEIGSGWGSFARHAAKNYGVQVVGLTVSKEQKKYSEHRCEGLDVDFLLVDYQKLESKYDGYFDRVVSIEMIEAVGRKNFRTYFSTIERVLKNDGLVGLQAIVGTGGSEAFLSTRIFPNGLVPSEYDIVKNSKDLLRIKQWTAFGKDYDKTLMKWDENFRKHWPKIAKLEDQDGNLIYDDEFYRMWRYYLMLCAGSFRAGHNDVAQIVLSKINSDSELK